MTAPAFDPAAWITRAEALGRSVHLVGDRIYFGRARVGVEEADASLFADLREVGGADALKPYLATRGARLAGLALRSLGRAA